MGAGRAAAFALPRLCGGGGRPTQRSAALTPAGRTAPGWRQVRAAAEQAQRRAQRTEGRHGFIVCAAARGRGAARCPAATAPARLSREASGSWVYSVPSCRLFCCLALCCGVKCVWLLARRLLSVLLLTR